MYTSLPSVEAQPLIVFQAQVDEHFLAFVRARRHLGDRAGRVDSRDLGREARRAVAVQLDVELVRPHVDHRRAFVLAGEVMAVERHFAEHRLAALHAAVEHVHLAEELHHELRRRLVEHFFRRADLFDPAVVHHHDAVGHFECFFLVVRHQDAGDVDLVVQPAEPGPQALPHLGVERAERLVEQQHLRLDGQCPGQRGPLPLAAGKLRREPPAEAVELHERQQLVHAVVDLRPWPAARCAAAPAGRTPRFRTRSCGGTTRSAGTRSRRGAAAAGRWATSSSWKRIRERVSRFGVSRPAMIRSSVVLPEPLGPSSATSSPSWIVRLTSRSAW